MAGTCYTACIHSITDSLLFPYVNSAWNTVVKQGLDNRGFTVQMQLLVHNGVPRLILILNDTA